MSGLGGSGLGLYRPGGGSRLALQRYALAQATEGGAAGIIDGAIAYDAATGTFTFPLDDGAADFTIGASRWLQWPLRNALGVAESAELEDTVRAFLRCVGPLPADAFAYVCLSQGGMAAPGGALAVGMAGDGLIFHATYASGAWAAPTNGSGADTLIRIVATQTGQRNSSGAGIAGACGYVADGSPSGVANSATPSTSANIGASGPWAYVALGVGRKTILAAPISVPVRLGTFFLDLRDIPGATPFLA